MGPYVVFELTYSWEDAFGDLPNSVASPLDKLADNGAQTAPDSPGSGLTQDQKYRRRIELGGGFVRHPIRPSKSAMRIRTRRGTLPQGPDLAVGTSHPGHRKAIAKP